MMPMILVADHPQDWPSRLQGFEIVGARDYLTHPDFSAEPSMAVCNLCRSYRYQTPGYYVSLLAEARGHRPLPSVSVIERMRSMRRVPQLRTRLHGAATDGAERIAVDYERWVADAMRDYARPHARSRRRHFASPTRLAILHDGGNAQPASNDAAIANFERAARELGVSPEVIGRTALPRIAGFDGLFIRDNTFIDHYTYRFSRRAEAAGLVVIDDPDSILRCNNKVYLAELLSRHRIPIPKTLIVHEQNIAQVAPTLGVPCVLKQPDSSLSMGVAKVESEAELHALASRLLRQSALIVAQEYLPTTFDWRIGIIARQPLFACKYFMVPGHWQIVRHIPGAHYEEGPTAAVPLEEAPPRAVALALDAANLVGDGFYGVDVKQLSDDDFRIIEVNDNPNVDAGNEDGVLDGGLYREVMAVFAQRMSASMEAAS